MNTLLTKMQEMNLHFESEKIVVMATMKDTSRQAHIDPGCFRLNFSWKLDLTPFSKEDRENIIRYYLKNVPHAKMDSKEILDSVPTNSTAGLIANIVNHAAIKALADNRSLVTHR